MFSLLAAALGAGEIILIVACVAIVVAVVVSVIVKRAKGKPACCDECSGNCPHCVATKKHTDETEE
ncbi:MAG: hypothetical protein J1F66_05720 [Clostridiales bacterium]|nr:hypothetical protein [Clostridiales bacterium]